MFRGGVKVVGLIVLGIISGCFLNICMMRVIKQMEGRVIQKKQCLWGFIAIEIGIFLMGTLCYKQYGISFMMWMNMSFWCVLMLLICVDLKFMILPTSIILIGSGIGVGFKAALSLMLYDWFYLWDCIVAGILGYGFFYVIYMWFLKVRKIEGLGFGDVRIMGMLGIYVGIEKLIIMLLIASVMALIVGTILYIIRRKSEAYPFGPWLCGAR